MNLRLMMSRPHRAAARLRAPVLMLVLGLSIATAQPTTMPALYEQDFQQAEPGSLPEDAKVLSGEFAVQQAAGERYLELAPVPLNTFGVMLGPERGVDTAIRARVRSASTGRRFPEHGIGLGGAGGYRLILMPAVGELQIRQNDAILARAPFQWQPAQWINLSLEIRSAGGGRSTVAGKAWPHGGSEPAAPLVAHEASNPPAPGRAVLWGTPYSEKPIHFDDVRIEQR